ncbi:hypothetical protein FDP41_012215 [Naegleria fowleri]|uniref:Uncharacterized protein n=1 Tax=Naegleria fowleri TaxID=5763 RepID=A0A6A5C6G0_NAEFO|nr:uncharacterized protein FDP41_012520 [Naegleria fowleri]XP_044566271.1 uncharacterized protein FDP41_012215 [Naegleria fowleri]KAF0981410.1 hypothetical protein FDP41_012520 [Naegleria fowleri]KAF0981558.1 hypothetical protein FDP41_012215 [Naegleria fowleri]
MLQRGTTSTSSPHNNIHHSSVLSSDHPPHLMDAPVLSASPIRSSKTTPLNTNSFNGGTQQGNPNSSRNTFVTSSTLLRDVSSSLNVSTSLNFEMNQHDLVFKQMERQRSELYQRMQDRIQRAKQLGHICKDQIGYLKTKIMDLEEKINEANNEHFSKHILQIDPKTALSTLSEVLSDDSDSVSDLYREDNESVQLANQLLLDQVQHSRSQASKGKSILSMSQIEEGDEITNSSPVIKLSPNQLINMYSLGSPSMSAQREYAEYQNISPLRAGENKL